ncbi:MAG: hypothetical protein EXS08_07955 [Planctomycetes bacterium]|nr:hypothetical protein [Planctomycetota bacterium]
MPTGTLRTALLLALPVFVACKSGGPSNEGEHWMVDSVPQRMAKHFTGYRADVDGRYIDFQYQKKKDISSTLRRHFLNNSPDSPFEADDPSATSRRPPHSPAPDPLYYFGAESLFFGVATLAMSGSFIPVPVDSVIATVFGGWGEFGRGFTEGANAQAETPPSVGRFRVKNR